MNTLHNTFNESNQWILDEQFDGFGQSNSFKLSFKYTNGSTLKLQKLN